MYILPADKYTKLQISKHQNKVCSCAAQIAILVFFYYSQLLFFIRIILFIHYNNKTIVKIRPAISLSISHASNFKCCSETLASTGLV